MSVLLKESSSSVISTDTWESSSDPSQSQLLSDISMGNPLLLQLFSCSSSVLPTARKEVSPWLLCQAHQTRLPHPTCHLPCPSPLPVLLHMEAVCRKRWESLVWGTAALLWCLCLSPLQLCEGRRSSRGVTMSTLSPATEGASPACWSQPGGKASKGIWDEESHDNWSQCANRQWSKVPVTLLLLLCLCGMVGMGLCSGSSANSSALPLISCLAGSCAKEFTPSDSVSLQGSFEDVPEPGNRDNTVELSWKSCIIK